MKITTCDYDELPDWVSKEDLPDNGSGREYASYLLIEDGKYKAVYSDAMEPEDARFYRDLGWIKHEIERAASKPRRKGKQ